MKALTLSVLLFSIFGISAAIFAQGITQNPKKDSSGNSMMSSSSSCMDNCKMMKK